MITLHFHLQPQYKYELFHTYFTSLHCQGIYELNKLTSLPMCGFIAQLVEHRNYHNCPSYWSIYHNGQEKPTAQEMEVKLRFPSQQASAFHIDTSTGTLRMTSSFTSWEDYLKHLHLFRETFGLHTKSRDPTGNRETRVSLPF